MEPNYGELERGYKEAVRGTGHPAIVACNGKVLNAELKTDKYDERLMYLISKNGIQAITPEEL